MWQTAFSLSISKSASLHFCLTGLQLLDMKFTANFKTVHMILLVFFLVLITFLSGRETRTSANTRVAVIREHEYQILAFNSLIFQEDILKKLMTFFI